MTAVKATAIKPCIMGAFILQSGSISTVVFEPQNLRFSFATAMDRATVIWQLKNKYIMGSPHGTTLLIVSFKRGDHPPMVQLLFAL